MIDNVAGYVYQGRLYCPLDVIAAIDGQAPIGDWRDAEPKLDYLAQMFGIDRYSEPSFRVSDFPKVIIEAEARENGHRLRCYVCEERLCAELSFNPNTPYTNAQNLLNDWLDSEGDHQLWYRKMVAAYGEDETIKLFELVVYERYSGDEMDGYVIGVTGDFLRSVGVIKARKV